MLKLLFLLPERTYESYKSLPHSLECGRVDNLLGVGNGVPLWEETAAAQVRGGCAGFCGIAERKGTEPAHDRRLSASAQDDTSLGRDKGADGARER